jgi:hypothetical protein
MQQTKPGGDEASQLIARLNGRRSPACRPSACGYGAPPPDHGPAPERAPALRPQRPRERERARAGARRRAVASLRPRSGRHAVCRASMQHTARRSTAVAEAHRRSTTVRRPSTTVHAASTTARGQGVRVEGRQAGSGWPAVGEPVRLGAAWAPAGSVLEVVGGAARCLTAPTGRGAVRPAEAAPGAGGDKRQSHRARSG